MSVKQYTTKLADELVVGDTIIFADLEDEIVAIDDNGSAVLAFATLRNGKPSLFYAGRKSVQQVEVRA